MLDMSTKSTLIYIKKRLYFWGVALIRLILLSVTRRGISEYLLLGLRLILTFQTQTDQEKLLQNTGIDNDCTIKNHDYWR